METKKSKTVMITGAAKRLGAVMALHMAKQGWNVVLHYNSSHAEVADIAQKIVDLEVCVELVCCDFSEMERSPSVIKATNLDLLINNASYFENDNISNCIFDNINRHMKINLIAPIILSKLFAERSKHADDPCIINMLDCNLESLNNNFLSYKLSKKALLQFTKISAIDLAPKIRVNGIALGQTLRNPKQSEEKFLKDINRGALKKRVSEENLIRTVNYILDNDNLNGNIIELTN